MPHYNYLIIGGGMTAAAAVDGIRGANTEGSVGLIGMEPDPPYDRPPLSRFTTNPAGAAVVVTVGPLRKVVQGSEGDARRYLVSMTFNGDNPGVLVQVQR